MFSGLEVSRLENRSSREWVKAKIAEGRVVKGHKIGLTSRAMQQASQITEPDYGTLLDDMFFEQGDIPFTRFIAPRVEVELAFVLGTADQFLHNPPYSLFSVMSGQAFFRGGPLPWVGFLASAAASATLYWASVANIARRDF